MPTTVKERLIAFLDYECVNKSEFGRRIGVSSAFVTSMRKSLQPDKIRLIQAEFPNLNINWLLTGEGSMLKEDSKDEVKALTDEKANRVAEDLQSDILKAVPLIPATAFAGGVKGFAPEGVKLSKCEQIASPIAGAELAIPITGKSMEPEYPDGSIAYIKRINEAAFIPWGHTVILDTENGAFIKNIFPDDQDESYIWAKSINTQFPPMHIPKSSIFRIFRVLGTARIFTTM